MAESDLSEIPNGAIRATLCETIEKKLNSKNYKVSVSSASKAGESNFVGIVHRVSFSKNGEDKKEKLILKSAPQAETRRDQFNSRILFLQEIKVYNKVNNMNEHDNTKIFGTKRINYFRFCISAKIRI